MRPIAHLPLGLWLSAIVALAAAPEPPAPRLTLDDAVARTLAQSKALQLARLQTQAAAAKLGVAASLGRPRLSATGLGLYDANPVDVRLREGSLDSQLSALGAQLGQGALVSMLQPFPRQETALLEGDRWRWVGSLAVIQPLSQLPRIGSGVRVAETDVRLGELAERRVRSEVRAGVKQVYAGLLHSARRLAAAEARLAAVDARLRDAENALANGEALDAQVLGLRAQRLRALSDRAERFRDQERLADLLADQVGASGGARFELDSSLPERAAPTAEACLADLERNFDLQAATETVVKARFGAAAARQARLPDLTAFAALGAERGTPYLQDRAAFAGVVLNWDLWDGGGKNSEVRQRRAELQLAEVALARTREEVIRTVRDELRALDQAALAVQLAVQALGFRQRAAELTAQSHANGLALPTAVAEAQADLAEAEADLAGARAQRHASVVRLLHLTDRLLDEPPGR